MLAGDQLGPAAAVVGDEFEAPTRCRHGPRDLDGVAEPSRAAVPAVADGRWESDTVAGVEGPQGLQAGDRLGVSASVVEAEVGAHVRGERGAVGEGLRVQQRSQAEIAHAAARTKDTQFGPRKRALAARRGTGRAAGHGARGGARGARRGTGRVAVALGHEILRIAFAMLRDGVPYRDPVIDPEALTARENLSRWLRMVRKAQLLPEVARRVQAELLRQKAAREKRRLAESAPALEPGSGAAERPALASDGTGPGARSLGASEGEARANGAPCRSLTSIQPPGRRNVSLGRNRGGVSPRPIAFGGILALQVE